MPRLEQYALRAFSEALDQVSLTLAENAGLNSIDVLTNIKAHHLKDNNPHLGVDCEETGTNDMRVQKIFETLDGKRQQICLATQVSKMILKIDDIFTNSSSERTNTRMGYS